MTNYRIAQLDEIPEGPCPCGSTRRAFVADDNPALEGNSRVTRCCPREHHPIDRVHKSPGREPGDCGNEGHPACHAPRSQRRVSVG